jgi:hypothetical protein
MKNWKQWLKIRENLYDPEDDNFNDPEPDYGNKSKNAVGFRYSGGDGAYTRNNQVSSHQIKQLMQNNKYTQDVSRNNQDSAQRSLHQIKQLMQNNKYTQDVIQRMIYLCQNFVSNYPYEDDVRDWVVNLHNKIIKLNH